MFILSGERLIPSRIESASVHRLGHLGVALLAYAPAGTVLSVAGEGALTLVGGLVALAFATLPDADEFLPIAHRGPTHSIVFVVAAALVVAALTGAAAALLGGRTLLVGTVCGGVAALSLVSHIAADSVTPMGIKPFWPLSERHYTFELIYSKNQRINRLLFLAGIGASGAGAVVVVVVAP